MTLMCISLNDVKMRGGPLGVQQDDRTHARMNSMIVLVCMPASWQWWVEEDLNLRPHAYQACALTT
jgi:hypothetical protein